MTRRRSELLLPLPPPEESSRRDVPRWVLTYADMVSLLVTFFILLMTYSSTEKEMYSKMAGSVLGAFGVISDPGTPNHESIDQPPPGIAHRVPEDGLRSDRLDLERVQEGLEILVRRHDHGTRLDLERTQHGVRLRLLEDLPFTDGGSELSESARRTLRELADLLRVHRQHARVVGHAWREGRRPDGTARDPEEISRERALEAATYLIGPGRVRADRVEVCAQGEREPLLRGEGPDARRLNRRLELWILPIAGEDGP